MLIFKFMKTLVTGGAGFIGSHTVDAILKQGHDVTVVDNFFSGREKNLNNAKDFAKQNGRTLDIIKGDISDPIMWKNLPKVDAVFHIAAQTSVTASVKESDRDFAWNIQAAKYLCDYIRQKGVRFLLYTNTAGALYGAANEIPTPEVHPLHPTSLYGATKSFLETYVRALAESLKMEKTWSNDPSSNNYFSWGSLRLGNVYGPRQITKGEAGVVPIFIEKFISHQEPTIFGTGKETRDYVHVDDVVFALMTVFSLQQKQKIDEAYNVGTGKETSTQQVFDLVKSALGDKTRTSKAQYQDLRPGELEKSCLNIDKISKLGWKPRWNFSDGVPQTVEFYLNDR